MMINHPPEDLSEYQKYINVLNKSLDGERKGS